MVAAGVPGLLAVFALPYISVKGISLPFWDFRCMPEHPMRLFARPREPVRPSSWGGHMRATLVLVFVGLVACGDDGNVSIDEADEVLRDEYCEYLARCGLVESEAACHDLNIGISLNIDPSLRAAIEAGMIKYDGSALARCYSSIGSITCDRTDESGRRFAGEECEGVIRGTVPDGGQCALDEECVSQECDVPQCPDACCQGTCVPGTGPAMLVEIGGPCDTTSDCTANGYCEQSTNLCTALKSAGATCQSTNECDFGLGCAGLAGRTCRTLPKAGEACPDGLCRDEGTYCNSSMQCAHLGLPGDPCTSRAECSTYYLCDGTGHCALGPHEGESCAGSLRCTDVDNFCDQATMTCKGRQPDGAACTGTNQCQSNYCAGTTGAMTCQQETICI